jgi:hypothetical protein
MVQAPSPASSPARPPSSRRAWSRSARRRTGIALSVVSFAVLAIGGGMSGASDASIAPGVAAGTQITSDTNPTTATTAPAGDPLLPTSDPTTDSLPDPSADPSADPNRRWTIMLGGDSLLTRKTPATLNPFARQKPLLARADLAIVNVETAIGNATDRQSKEFTFRSPVRFAQLMGEAGIDVGSLANNHTLDFGDQGLIDSIDALNDAGVVPVGAGVNLAAALQPSTHTINGVRVAVLAASQVIPAPSWVATKNSIGIASAGKHSIDAATRQLLAAVSKARQDHNVVLVYLHWGKEREVCPTTVQQQLGRLLRDAGATAVIGAHPHVLQPIVRDVKAGDNGVIAYSLGNFIWDPRTGITADSGVLELGFVGSTMTDITFHPHRLDSYGWAAPARGDEAQQRILGQVQRKCTGADGTGSLGAFNRPAN